MGECKLVELIGVKIVRGVTQSAQDKLPKQVIGGRREDQLRRVDDEGQGQEPQSSTIGLGTNPRFEIWT
jgi:hypothetical protein